MRCSKMRSVRIPNSTPGGTGAGGTSALLGSPQGLAGKSCGDRPLSSFFCLLESAAIVAMALMPIEMIIRLKKYFNSMPIQNDAIMIPE